MAGQTSTGQVIQRDHMKPQSAGEKVVVACKIPTGLRLRVFSEVEDREPTPSGVREIKVWRPREEEVLIYGPAFKLEPGKFPKYRILAGYALTEGVDRDFFELWLKQNENQPYVKNKLIFAMPNIEGAEAKAKEHESQLSGLEPMQKDGDPRRPGRTIGQAKDGGDFKALTNDE